MSRVRPYSLIAVLALILAVSPMTIAQTITVSPYAPIGQPIDFQIDTGSPNTGYFFDVSARGTQDGLTIPISGREIPLTSPLIWLEGGGSQFPLYFQNFLGTSDSQGLAMPRLLIPDLPFLAGRSLFAAFVTLNPGNIDGVDFISQPVQTVLVQNGTHGWTDLSPDPNTIVFYVSSSSGNDSNDGLSPTTAVKTLAHARSLLRNGMPDHLLLKRGNVWNENLDGWNKSGMGPSAPIVIGTYGTHPARPLLRTGSSSGFRTNWGAVVSNVAISGIHFHANSYNGYGGPFGIAFDYDCNTMLIEDCKVEGYATNVKMIPSSGRRITNVAMYRNVIVDAFAKDRYSAGLYAEGVDGLTLGENVFDRNGWNPALGDGRTVNDHNAYVQVNCTGLVATGNFFARGSSHGLQARPGGVVRDNVFYRNAIGMSFGIVLGQHSPLPGGVTGSVTGNVFVEGDDISSSKPRGFGLELGNISSAQVSENLFVNDVSSQPWGVAINMDSANGVGAQNLTISNNTIFDWRGGILVGGGGTRNITLSSNFIQQSDTASFLTTFTGGVPSSSLLNNNVYHTNRSLGYWFKAQSSYYSFPSWQGVAIEAGSCEHDVQFRDPSRNFGTYMAEIGGTPTGDALLTELRTQSRSEWKPEYDIAALRRYIRYGMTPEDPFATVGAVSE